jgi:hypothetical protein
VLSVLIFAFLIPDKTSNEEQRDTLGQTPQAADLFAALLRPPVLLFFLEVFVFGMCIGAVESLLFVYRPAPPGARGPPGAFKQP